MRATTATLLAGAAALAMALALASLSTLYWLRGNELARVEAESTSAKASSRKAWQKVYDMQEGQNEELEAAEGRASIELWKVQTELEACRKGK